jgi:predicted nucleotidyltransferase
VSKQGDFHQCHIFHHQDKAKNYKSSSGYIKNKNYLYNLIKLWILFESHALSSGSLSPNLHFTILLHQIQAAGHTLH